MWLIAALVIAIIFVGYGYTKHIETAQYYRNSFQQGERAIKAAKYRAAEEHFRNAQKRKANSDIASDYVKQIQQYRAGLQASKQGRYDDAKAAFNEAAGSENGSPILVRRASAKETELGEAMRELKIFQKNYKKARILSSNYEYTASNMKLATILGYGNIDKPYYDEVYRKAVKLEAYNNRILLVWAIERQRPLIVRVMKNPFCRLMKLMAPLNLAGQVIKAVLMIDRLRKNRSKGLAATLRVKELTWRHLGIMMSRK